VWSFLSEIGLGSWPDWVAAVGTTMAFGVAAQSYRHSVVLRRESQARLVFSKVVSIEYFEAGAILDPLPHESRLGNGTAAVDYVPTGSFAQIIPTANRPVLQATVVVHNGSAELIGPVKIQMVDIGLGKVFEESSILATPVEPNSDFVVTFTLDNPHHPNQPSIGATIIFRDASGRWWRRHLLEPVEAVHADPENSSYTQFEMASFAAMAHSMGHDPSPEPEISWLTRLRRLKRKLRGKSPIP
jgi:hypothetical protein